MNFKKKCGDGKWFNVRIERNWKNSMRMCSVRHTRNCFIILPNTTLERFYHSLKAAVSISQSERQLPETVIHNILVKFYSTNQPLASLSPAAFMIRRQMRVLIRLSLKLSLESNAKYRAQSGIKNVIFLTPCCTTLISSSSFRPTLRLISYKARLTSLYITPHYLHPPGA